MSLRKNEEGGNSENVKSDDASGVGETTSTRTEISGRIRSLLATARFENVPIERFQSRFTDVEGKEQVREILPTTQAWTTQVRAFERRCALY